MTTYAETNTAEVDVTVDTETIILDTTIPSGKGGTIKKIMIAGGTVETTAKETSAMVELKLGSHEGPFRFPVWCGNVDADVSVIGCLPTQVIDVDIPVMANETVKIYVTPNFTLVGCHIGIIWVA